MDSCLKWIPVAALTVSTASFLFALGVLYPWHIELSREFMQLRNVCEKTGNLHG